MPPTTPRLVLLCGHRAFAARGLAELLRSAGHRVVCFSRGATARDGDTVSGPVTEVAANPCLTETFDTVINYILLQGESVEANLEYVRSLLALCEARGAKHLIHISSCSAFRNSARLVNEDAPIETDPRSKGLYGATKAAQETYIAQRPPRDCVVSYVRPGLVIADGMNSYLGGIGVKLPWNSILGLGNPRSQLAMVTREAVSRVVATLVDSPPSQCGERLLLAASPSPTRRQYLGYCVEALGAGTYVRFLPVWLWLVCAFLGDLATRAIGQGSLRVYAKVRSVCRYQEFDARRTQERTGVAFGADWPAELRRAVDHQDRNYDLPPAAQLATTSAKNIIYIGFGRIVRQRHVPALRRLGFGGALEAFDVRSGVDQTGQRLHDLARDPLPPASDLYVVATPGPAHHLAVDQLRHVEGPILVEKPLAYSEEEFERWLVFAKARHGQVYVCHDRRFKRNVLAMLDFLRRYNAGSLLHVSAIYQAPPVSQDSAHWLRDERGARTLLLDYGLHPVDLACMFGRGQPSLKACRYALNARGETCLIEVQATFDNHSVHLLLRQGLGPRRTRIEYTFQNYALTLGFQPDVFVPRMADENFGLAWLEGRAELSSTLSKLRDRLTGKESETSHAYALQTALSGESSALNVTRLAPVYALLFQIGREVYGVNART